MIKILSAEGEVIESYGNLSPEAHFLKEEVIEVPVVDTYELSYKQIQPILHFLGYSQQEAAEVLEVDTSTLTRWRTKEDKLIGKLRSKTMFDIDAIIAKGIRIFGSGEGLKAWLHAPNHALGNRKPIDLLKDPYGMELVDDAIEAISWGNIM